MKRQTQVVLSVLSLSAFLSFPAMAQTNSIEDVFNSVPTSNGDQLTEPLSPVEAPSRDRQEDSSLLRPITETPRSSNGVSGGQIDRVQDSGASDTIISPPAESIPRQ